MSNVTAGVGAPLGAGEHREHRSHGVALDHRHLSRPADTANAATTVIYTHRHPAPAAVGWPGCWNLSGVISSSGLVAFGIITLLLVELILPVGSSASFAVTFALYYIFRSMV
jgi:PiT family inorganic phosphate transporter